MDLSSILEMAMGNSYDELVRKGGQNYPSQPQGSRHHAQAAEQTASKFGFIPSQLLGLGVEGVEGLTAPKGFDPQDAINDILANLRGGAVGSTQGVPILGDIIAGRLRR